MICSPKKRGCNRKVKKKVLAIGHSFVIALNRSLMREIHHRGTLDVTVVTPAFFHGDLRPVDAEPEPARSSLRVIPVDCYLTKYIHFFFYSEQQICELLDRERFDFVYLWEEPYIVSGFQISRLLKKRGIPYAIFTCQNILKKYPFPFSAMDKSVLSGAEFVFPCGRLVADCLEQKGFPVRADVASGFFVDVERFQPPPLERVQTIKKQLVLEDAFTIGYLGRFNVDKGCEVFMRTLEALPQTLTWKALMVGGGVLEPQVRSWIEKNGWQNKVFLHSVTHDQVPDLLAGMDVLVCPSQTMPHWQEQFGRMLVEAMAMGVPVVGSRSGEIPYVLADAGKLADPRDTEGFAREITRVATDPQLHLQMRQKGLQRAALYSTTHMAGAVEQNILAALANLQ